MKLDFQEVADCIESRSGEEPFPGVVYLTRGEEVLFEGAYGSTGRRRR